MIAKKNILYVHHAGGFGGAPKSLSYIIKNLDRNIYEPTLVNIKEGPINNEFEKLPVKLIKVRGIRPFHGSTVVEKSFRIFLRNWLYLIPSILRAVKIINGINPQIMHLNSTCLFAFAIAAKLSKAKPKVVCHVREPLREGFWGWPLRFFCKRYVDGFIAISDFDLKSLHLNPANRKIKQQVIYNFVNREEYFPASGTGDIRENLGIKPDDIVFIYLARFSKSNGWQELMQMATELNNRPDIKFLMLGATEEQLQAIKPVKNVHVLTFKPDVVNYLREADVYVCPFTEPHFARGVIEASAVGLPVLATDIGGVNELVRDNETGYLYTNASQFISFTQKLANDKELRKQMGQKGVEFAADNFDQIRNLQLTYAFYEQL